MQILGLTIARTATLRKELQSVDTSRGWYPLVREPYAGAWQRNDPETVDSVLAYGPVFACQTLIASDIAKMRCRLVELDANGIWSEVDRNSPFWPVLIAGIARVDFRTFFGYGIVFGVWWFVLGVAIFTFLV